MTSAACPSEELLASFFARRLSREQEDDLESHLDTCPSCRRAVAAMAVAFSKSTIATEADPTSPSDVEAPLALPPGAQLGRYVVLRQLGRGGMGVVYAALDPTLERTVAVKLLAEQTATAEARTRLLEEAKVLAKLSHPNVVAVHDVGFFGGRPFVAMERIDGESLRARLRQGSDDRTELLALLLAAGEGLCAIHAAGLVHRDFKPENVLCGADGRVRVVDLGLARAAPSVVRAEPGDNDTRVAGTPAYMAPEQRRGERVDARADQYSFAVTAWEALFGERPTAPRGASTMDTTLSLSRIPRSDRALARTLARALSGEPSDRFDSLRDLLDRMKPRRARWPTTAAVAALALLAAGAAAAAATRPEEADACEARRASEHRAFTGERRERVRAALDGSVRAGDGTTETVLRALDAYAGRLSSAAMEACALGRRPEGAAPAQLRSRCLDDRRRTFDALVSVLSEPSADLALRGPRAVAGLPPLEDCARDEALLRQAPPPDPEAREAVEAAAAVMRHGAALGAAGRYTEAEDVLEGVLGPVEATGYEPLLAEWLLARGAVAQTTVSGDKTEELLRRATFVGEASRNDAVAAEAWIRYAKYLAWQGMRFDRAELATERADAALLRLGGDARKSFQVRRIRAFIRAGSGDLSGSLALLRDLIRAQEESLGQDDLDLVDTKLEHARVALLSGLYEESLGAAEDGVRVGAATLGTDHPDTAELRHLAGAAALRLGRLDVARSELRRARTALEAAFGTDHTKVDFVLADLARLASTEGSHDEAIALAEKGVAIDVARFGEGTPPVAFALVPLADVLLAAGRPKEALAAAERAAAVWRAIMPPDHYLLVEAETLVALARAVSKDDGEILALAERARAHYAERGGPPERRAAAALAAAIRRNRDGDAEAAAALVQEAARHLQPLGRYGASLSRLAR